MKNIFVSTTTQMGIVSLPFGYGVSSFSAVEQQVVLPDPTPVKGHFEAEVEMEFEIELPAVEEFRKLPDEFYKHDANMVFDEEEDKVTEAIRQWLSAGWIREVNPVLYKKTHKGMLI